MRKARALRGPPGVGSAGFRHPEVRAYRAAAEGHVYFFLDREDGGAPIPMRVDQVAVDLYGNARGRTRQVVRGLRRRELLPVQDFDYYIDRLTAVQNGFGDWIEVGTGLDVRGVPHPLGALGERTYRYRLADSVRISVPTLEAPLRVYEIEVRPLDEEEAAMVGSVFVEAETGALVRMAFGFTPASYVDPRNDRVTVRLEHSLWEETLWLPYRQVVEVRRELPGLALPVGSIIRATLEVSDYVFNPDLGPDFFMGPALTLRPYNLASDSAVFRRGLMDGMAAEGLSPVSLAAVEAEARRLARTQLASGLPTRRLYADRVSSVLRVNRAEGVRFGLGAEFAPGARARVQLLPGYATESGLSGRARAVWTASEDVTVDAGVHHRALRDAGPLAGASGAVNSVAMLALNRDYSDPWFATGAEARVEAVLGGRWEARAEVRWETVAAPESAASLWRDEPGRPLRPVDEGVLARADASLARRWGGSDGWMGRAEVRGGLGRWSGDEEAGGGDGSATGGAVARGGVHGVLGVRLETRAASADLSRRFHLVAMAGQAWGVLPRQLHFFAGGRGTLPGHDFRAFGGRAFTLSRAELSVALVPGRLSGRLIAGAGAVGGGIGRGGAQGAEASDAELDRLHSSWGVGPTDGWLGYVGAGAGLAHEILWIDVARGFPNGSFEVVVSVDPRLWPYL